MSEYKRQFRELSDETKDKISQSTKGKRKSFSHRQHLSQALTDYWKSVPSRGEHLTMQEYLHGEENNEVKSSNADDE